MSGNKTKTMVDLHGAMGEGWIGVDLDGTLAFYDGWKGATSIGEPIPKMMDRVREWLDKGRKVKILTARVAPGKCDEQQCRDAIYAWLTRHGLAALEVTHAKDHKMIELWDDRVVQVIPNTGERADGKDIAPTTPTDSKWQWMMDYCKKAGVSPTLGWEAAKKAWNKEHTQQSITPTVPGWYWVRLESGLIVCMEATEFGLENHLYEPPFMVNVKFSGPIPLPEGWEG